MRKNKTILRVEKKMDDELKRQVAILYSATAIALFRHWGWRKKRILDFTDLTKDVWHECASTNERSMPQMLEEETGIDLRNETGKNWSELAFLNAKIDMTHMTVEQWIYMRQRQIPWIAPNVTACILLSLNRKCGFGPVRCQRLVNQITDIRAEFNNNERAIRAACKDEVGISVIDYMDEEEIANDQSGEN